MSRILKQNDVGILLIFALLAACSSPDPSTNNDPGADSSQNNTSTDAGEDLGDEVGTIPLVDPIHVMTWNVQKYFDTECDSGNCDDGDFESTVSQAEFAFRATQISDAIIGEEPDVILFQELEKEVCLDEIAQNLGFSDTAFGETFFSASLDVGVTTRGTITDVILHRDDTVLERLDGGTEKFAREFLEVHIDIDGRTVIAFNAHFKAKRNDDPFWRLAEADGARDIVTRVAEENPEALVVMGGDLNDTPGSDPIDALEEELDLVSSDETWTYFFGEEQAIDHLLFAPRANVGVDEESVRVVRNSQGNGLSNSDHAALIATFGFVE